LDKNPSDVSGAQAQRLQERKDACIFVVRFLSRRMMDPHLYFETKFISLIRRSTNMTDLHLLMDDLIDWTQTAGLSEQDIRNLNESLSTRGLPVLDELSDRP
jgi:hypothetical protein